MSDAIGDAREAKRISLSQRAAWLDLTDRDPGALYATALPDGPPVVLRGPAAVIFRAAVGGGTADEVAARVAVEAGQSPEVILADVLGFLDELIDLGILSRR
jgi:hypothetical protein